MKKKILYSIYNDEIPTLFTKKFPNGDTQWSNFLVANTISAAMKKARKIGIGTIIQKNVFVNGERAQNQCRVFVIK